eukprot:1846290-Prymnesium_polylepis.1
MDIPAMARSGRAQARATRPRGPPAPLAPPPSPPRTARAVSGSRTGIPAGISDVGYDLSLIHI